MDGKELIDALVGHLAWPVLVFLLCMWFKGPITELLSRIKSAKVGPAEISFGDQWINGIADALPGAVIDPDADSPPVGDSAPATHPEAQATPPSVPDMRPADRLSEYSWELAGKYIPKQPSDSVIYEYGRLVWELGQLVSAASRASPGGIREFMKMDAAELANRAVMANLITFEMADSVRALRRLYSLAQASPEKVTGAQAEEFALVVEGLLTRIEYEMLKLRRAAEAETAS